MRCCALLTLSGWLVTGLASAEELKRELLQVSVRTGNPEIFLVDPGDGTARNLTKHPGRDLLPAWSPDGKRVAFVSDRDGNFNLYVMDADGSNVKQLTRDQAGTPPVNTPSWSPDGKRLVVGRRGAAGPVLLVLSADGTDPETICAGEMPAWHPTEDRIAFVKSHLGGSSLVTCDSQGKNEKVLRLKGGPRDAALPAWSPDGKLLAFSARTELGVDIWLADGALTSQCQLTHLGGTCLGATWTPDGKEVAFSYQQDPRTNGFIIVRADGAKARQLMPRNGEPFDPTFRLAFRPHPKEDLQPVANAERTLEPVAASLLVRVHGHLGPTHDVRFSPDGKTLASVAGDRTVALWSLDANLRPTKAEPLLEHKDATLGLAWHPEGKTLTSTSFDGTLIVWDVAAKKLREKLENVRAHAALYTPDGKYLISGGLEGDAIVLRDAETLTAIREFVFHPEPKMHAAAMTLSSDGKALICSGGSWDRTGRGRVIAWDIDSGEELWRQDGVASAWGVAAHPDGKTLACTGLDGKIRILDAASGTVRETFRAHGDDRAIGLAFSPDGKTLVSCGWDHTIRLWDGTTFRSRGVLAGHLERCERVGFSADGIFATTGYDAIIALWKLK